MQSSIVIQDMEERRLQAIEEDFMTDRVTEQSHEQKGGFYLVLEADDEHLSNQLKERQPSRSFRHEPDSCPHQIQVLLQESKPKRNLSADSNGINLNSDGLNQNPDPRAIKYLTVGSTFSQQFRGS